MFILRLLLILSFWGTPLAAQHIYSFNDLEDPLLNVRAKVPVISLHPDGPETVLYQEPLPRWVSVIAIPSPPKKHHPDVDYLLIDRQLFVDNETTFYHVAKRVYSSTAIRQHSMVAMSYDPSFQKITLHSLCIHRRDQKIDKSASADFHLMPTNISDDAPSPSKHWSLVALLDDVREGDVIEFSYCTHGHNPSYREHTVDACAFQYPYGVERIFYRVLGDEPCRVRVKAHHTQNEPQQLSNGNNRWECVCNATHVAPYLLEKGQPSWYQEAPWIQVSEFSEWSDVACWGDSLFVLREPLPDSAEALVKTWRRQYKKPEERALAALRFVQDSIGLIDEECSELHYPTSLRTILERRAADRVEKAYLLKALLQRMGIQAVPAAVSTYHRHTVAHWLPSPAAFNHVILHVRIGDHCYWVDPALSDQGGDLQRGSCSIYTRALLLEPTARELVCLGCVPAGPQVIAASTYYLWPDKLECSLLIETRLSGEAADTLRHRLHQEGKHRVAASFRCSYAHLYGEITEVSEADFEDMRDLNVINVREHYRATNPWQIGQLGRQQALRIVPCHISSKLVSLEGNTRRAPLALSYPTHVVETVQVVAPGHQWDNVQVSDHILSKAMECHVNRWAAGDTVTLCSEFKVLTDHIDTRDMDEYHTQVAAIEEVNRVDVNLPTEHRYPWDITYPFIINLYLALAIALLAIDPENKW